MSEKYTYKIPTFNTIITQQVFRWFIRYTLSCKMYVPLSNKSNQITKWRDSCQFIRNAMTKWYTRMCDIKIHKCQTMRNIANTTRYLLESVPVTDQAKIQKMHITIMSWIDLSCPDTWQPYPSKSWHIWQSLNSSYYTTIIFASIVH